MQAICASACSPPPTPQHSIQIDVSALSRSSSEVAPKTLEVAPRSSSAGRCSAFFIQDVLPEVAPKTLEEKKRVMHKSYSLDMFDESPMKWLVPDGQGTLHSELQKLGVDTVVQVGAWTDDCIISTAFHAFSLQYDVVLIEDGVSTASKQHFNAIEVMRGAAAKVLVAQDVVRYFKEGQPVKPPVPKSKIAGPRIQRLGHIEEMRTSLGEEKQNGHNRQQRSIQTDTTLESGEPRFANELVLVLVACIGPASFLAGWMLRGRFGQSTIRDMPLL